MEVPKSCIIMKSAVVEGHVCTVQRGGVCLFLLQILVANSQNPFMFLFDAVIIGEIIEKLIL